MRRLAAIDAMIPQSPCVVIVEDDDATRRFLADNLAADGYAPVEAATALEARRMLAAHAPELAIIDLGLPDADGLELLHVLRRGGEPGERLDAHLPVLILSGRAGELDRVRGFERGCDDYLVKPFSYAELRGRIRALMRRARTRPRMGRIRVGSLEIDPVARQAWLAGAPVALSKKEFDLVRTLALDPTRVFTREELLRDVWGYKALGTTRTLDSHAARVRRKLSGDRQAFIVNVWGVGYRLIDDGSDR
jgi:DNA-binding response OmpR family regulator